MSIKLNKNQKKTVYVAISLITLTLVIWILYGAEIFTKTEVLVEIEDELFGTTKEWRKEFVWGLDLSLMISAITIAVSLVVMYFQKNKRDKNES